MEPQDGALCLFGGKGGGPVQQGDRVGIEETQFRRDLNGQSFVLC
jgi:hypothetical protein